MPKDKEGKGTEEFGVKIPTDETPQEEIKPEEKTPTPDELRAQYDEQIQALTRERDEYKTGLSTAHSKLSKADQELKRRAEDTTWRKGMEERFEIMASILDKRLASGELDDTEKLELRKEFGAIAEKQKHEIAEMQRQAEAEEYSQKAMAIFARAKEVYPDDDAKLLRIERYLDKSMLDEANALVAKAESKTTDTNKETKVESEEDRFAKRLEEEKRKWMEEHGMLVSESGGPSGAPLNEQKIRENYRNNPGDPKARSDYLTLQKAKKGY